jgi:hypothetical protein
VSTTVSTPGATPIEMRLPPRLRRFTEYILAVAHHEAGHAAACHEYGIRYRYVYVSLRTPGNGHVRGYIKDYRETEEEIVFLCAGPIAEVKFLGRAVNPYVYESHARSDRSKADALARKLCDSEKSAQQVLARCWDVSNEIVEQRWSEIQAVAFALIGRPKLRYAEVARVVKARKNK